MINPKQLKDLIIVPVLKEYDLYSKSAVNLLLGTCAQESRMGYYLKQVKGPALGIYQMERPTELDIHTNVIQANQNQKFKWSMFDIEENFHDAQKEVYKNRLISDLDYATLMCRLQYWRFPEALPEADDIEGLAKYWKQYYNTEKGKGTVEQFVGNYHKYVE